MYPILKALLQCN